jgi:hypothetical protein
MSLSIGEFQKPGRNYWNTFRDKVMNRVPLVTKNSGEVYIDYNETEPQWQFLKNNNSFNDEVLQGLSQWQSGRSIRIPTTNEGLINLSEILKINVTQGSGRARYNLGDVAEGVMSCAIAARFISKNRKINVADFERVLQQMRSSRSGTSASKTFQSENSKHPKMREMVYDDVLLSINLAQANMDMLMTNDPGEYSILRQSLIPPCISYANSPEINTAALLMYRNGKKDFIEIVADGIGNQTGTKVDINLRINGSVNVPIVGNMRNTTLSLTQISLKKEVNQFAQVGGWSLDTIDRFWGRILNSNPSSNTAFQNLYTSSSSARGTTEEIAANTMRQVYSWANGELQKKLTNSSWISHFINTLDDFATYLQSNVYLVEINPQGFHRYDFKKLNPFLMGPRAEYRLTSSYGTGRSGLPSVTINAVNKQSNQSYPLIQFRFKMEKGIGGNPKAIRNYVEKQSGLSMLIT